jgi:hypothetical protein
MVDAGVDADPPDAAMASAMLESIHGIPQLGHSSSSAGRGVPQWTHTGGFSEDLVMTEGYG